MKLLHLLFAAALTAAAVPSHADASPWGIAAHPHSEMEWKNIDKELSMMRDAGMTSLRHDMKFSQVARKKGEYDFSRYDELLAKLDEYGIEFLPILEGYDWEIEKSRPDAVPLYKHPDEWRKFVRACAQHYKGKLKTWEIWNEQDGGFWKPNPNASQYVPLLKIAYEELKAADPENIVMVGGLCGWKPGYLKEMYASGAKGFFDAIAVHPYGWGPDRSGFQKNRMAEFKQLMAEHGDAGKPLWITECGSPTHRSSFIARQPDVLVKAIRFAIEKTGGKAPAELVIGAPVSQEFPDRDFVDRYSWLPGVKIVPVTPEELAKADPAKLPVFLGCDHTTVEADYKSPMLDYVKHGGVLLAFGEVPMYNLRFRNGKGIWNTRGATDELHPYYGIGYQAWWTQPGIPKHSGRARTTEAGKAAGIADFKNIYVTRFLTAANVKPGDSYLPLIEMLDGNEKHVGEGLALYTFKDRKGAILACSIQFAGGFTEDEQAHLLQTIYLSYLANGVARLYFYDFHCDGENPAEKENNFGIVRWNFQPKPAYVAYKAMTAALGRAPKFIERLPNLPEGVEALLFERSEGGKVLAVWSTLEPHRFEYVGKSILAGTRVTFIAL